MEAAEDRRALVLNAALAAAAAVVPYWFYNHGVKYPILLTLSNMFSGLAWDPIGLNLLLAVPFVVLAVRTLRRAGSLRKPIRSLIVVLSVICFIYILQVIFMLAVWSINGFAP